MMITIVAFVQFLLALVYLSIFIGWGVILNKYLRVKIDSAFERIFFLSILGISFVILFITLLGLLGIFYNFFVFILLIGLVGLRKFKITIVELKWTSLMLGILFPIMVLTLYPATRWDDISYHLPIAQSLLIHHKIIFQEFIRYPVFPINGEIFFSIGLALNQQTAQLMSWLALFLLSLGCFCIVERKFSKIYGLLSYLLLLSNIIILILGTINYIDIVLSLFLTAGILAFVKYIDENNTKWIYLSGIFLGTAIGVKYTAAIICLLMCIILFTITRNYKLLFKYGVLISIIGIPWYIRNLIYTGNPVWPFLNSFFGDNFLWNASDYIGQYNDFKSHGIDKTLNNFLKIPWYLYKSEEGSFNVLIWIGLAFNIFFIKKKSSEKIMFIIVACYTLFWFLSVNLSRYYVPIMPTLCILSAFGFSYFLIQLNDKKIKYSFIGIFIIGLLLIQGTYINHRINDSGLPPIKTEEKESYLSVRLPTYKATKIISEFSGTTYGLFNENMYYYGNQKLIGDWFGKGRYSEVLGILDKPKELNKYLSSLGVNYFLVNKTRLSPVQFQNIKLDSSFKKIYEDNNTLIYQLIK
ncbi:glycosyltransferase family 39 protein [Paenibacillus alginolyticus]|uniref:ArnT family glycosyltransferase n=1 Tax=Paenibacillus alginolyticus TaxID=59839 RepID=UPI000418C901|nr:glycosyltransferase family 39 protein [Paenibacillus alginolyticus]MCY9664835.1 glycosyltransferase family 39 protein [Paenibacillus alginolyticus]